MIEFYKADTLQVIDFSNRKNLMQIVYAPVSTIYQQVYCKLLKEAIEYYKDVPITKHIITDSEKRKVAKDPSYKDRIPKYEIKGYDDFITQENFDDKVKAEFYARYMLSDKEIVDLVNNFHPVLKAKLV